MRKKILAVVLCLMTAVAFMPTFAFATVITPAVEFNADYSKVTASYEGETVTVDTVSTFKEDTGEIEITADSVKLAKIFADDATYEQDKALTDALAAEKVYFYDLTDADVVYSSEGKKVAVPSKVKKEQFEDIITPGKSLTATGVKLYEPSYCKDYNAKQVKEKYISFYTEKKMFAGWKASFKVVEGTYDPESFEEQTVTVPVEFEAIGTIDGTTNKPFIKGNAIEKTFVIAATTPKTTDAKFWIDEAKDNALTSYTLNTEAYDGKEHKIVTNELAGVSVAYSKLNKKTGQYEAVDAITWKDVAAKETYKAVIKDSTYKKAADARTVDFEITVVTKATVSEIALKDGKIYSDESYDEYDYVSVTATPAGVLKNDADNIKAFVKAKYDVTATPDKFENKIALAIKEKATLSDEEKAVVDAFEENYNIDNVVLKVNKSTSKIEVVPAVKPEQKADEIEFTAAPTSKTYKVKALKKASKSFTVKAEAASEKAVTYKLINANSKIKIDKETGKITLKKGLKKGTYKIKVKAYTIEDDAFKAASETQAITIKVKK